MAKITLTDPANFNSTALAQIATNHNLIEAAIENTLSRDGTSPNQMEADLDLNNNDLLNAGSVYATDLLIDGSSITTLVTRAETAATNAEADAVEVAADTVEVNALLVEARVLAGNLTRYEDRAAVAAATVPVGIDNIVVEAYSSAAPSKGRANYRAASDADYTAMPALLRQTDATGRKFVINEPTLHLTMAGAVGDGSTDDTTAINAALEWLRITADQTVTLHRPAVVTGNGYRYAVTGSLDGTMIRLGKGWCLRDIWIHGTGAGKTILDLTASRFGYFDNVHIVGGVQAVSANDPHTGILISVGSDPALYPCDSHTWVNCSVDGYFSHSAYTEYGSEVTSHVGCLFWNRRLADTGKPAYAGVLQGRDTIAMVSDYQTLATGRVSYTVKHYDMCRFQKPFGLAGPTLYIEDIASTKFTKPYLANNANEAIIWKVNAAFVPYAIEFDGLQIETTGQDTAFLFDGGGSGSFAIEDLRVSCGNLFTDTAMFDTTGLTQLTLGNFDLRIPRWNSASKPTNVFANAGTFKIMGRLALPAYSDLEAFSTFVSGSEMEVYGHSGQTTRFLGTKRHETGYHLLNSGSVQVSTGGQMNDDTAISITLANLAATQGKFELWSTSAGIAATVFYRATSSPLILLSTLGANVNAVTATTLAGTTGTDGKFTIAINNGVIMLENRFGFPVNYRYSFVSQ